MKRWYERSIFIIILLIWFFPVGLFLMWKYSKWNKAVKGIISGLFAGMFLLVMLSPTVKVESIELSIPDYQSEYDINTDIVFSTSTYPENATSTLTYHSNGETIAFSKTGLNTGNAEGNFDIYVEADGKKSNVLSITVVDMAARKAEEAAAKEAEEKAAMEAEEKRLAEEKAAKEAEEKRLAEEKAAREIEEKRLAEKKAAKEAEEKRLAEEKAAKEAEEKRLAEEKAAKEAEEKQLAEEKAAKEAEEKRLAEEKAAKEAEEKRLAEEKVAKETEEKQLAEANTAQNETAQNKGNGSGNGENFNTYDNEEQQNTSANYVLNTSRHKFHKPDCPSVKKIAPQNYATSNDRNDIIAQGYDPCGNCHP